MNECLKIIVLLLIQNFMFYIFPLFAGPTDTIGMVLLILIMTYVLSMLVGIIFDNRFKYFYPILIALMFIPSIFIYYNESALIHSVWYFVVSITGIIIGILIKKLLFKK